MRRTIVALLLPVLIGAAATVGLLTSANDRWTDPGNITVIVLEGCALTVNGDYVYNPPPAYSGNLSSSVTLHVWCNGPAYTINIKANDVVRLGGVPATDITLNSFHYTGTSGDTALTLADAPLLTGTRTPAGGTDHPAELRLLNLTGTEAPGTYTTTVVFTIVTP